MIDERTPHYSLPLPHPENLLEEDVGRIRQAAQQIDALIHGHEAQLDSHEAQLESNTRRLRRLWLAQTFDLRL